MTLEKQIAEDYGMVLKEAQSMGCNKIKALYNIPLDNIKAIVNALEEIEQYRAIGTPEECRAAVEKQTAAKPLGGMDIEGNEYAICRECSAILSDGEWFAQYCPDCGKKVDWREKE